MTSHGRRKGIEGAPPPVTSADARKAETEQSSVAIYARDLLRLRHVTGSSNPEKLRELLDYYVPTYNEDEITERWKSMFSDALARDLRVWTMWTLQWSDSVKRAYYDVIGPEEQASGSRISRIMSYLSVFDVLEHIKFHVDRFVEGKYDLFVPPFRRPESGGLPLTESTAFASDSTSARLEIVIFQREKATLSHHVGDEFALRMTSSRELIDWLYIPMWKSIAARCVRIKDRGSLWTWLVMLEERDIQLHRNSRELFGQLMAVLPHFDINEISAPYDQTVRAASHQFFQEYFEAESKLVLREVEASAAATGGGVIDFGCGTGDLLGRCAERLSRMHAAKGPPSDGRPRQPGDPYLIGVDHAAGMIREAKKKREANKDELTRSMALITADIRDFHRYARGPDSGAENSDQKEEIRRVRSFRYGDTPHFAIMANVLTNVPRFERIALLRSARSALVPGDRLIVTSYNADRFDEWAKDVYTHVETLTGPIQIGEFDRATNTYINPSRWFFSHWFSLNELSGLVRDAGFMELRRGAFDMLGNYVLCEVPKTAERH